MVLQEFIKLLRNPKMFVVMRVVEQQRVEQGKVSVKELHLCRIILMYVLSVCLVSQKQSREKTNFLIGILC